MDPNIQNILLGLLTNGLTAFIAQFARKDSKMLLGEDLVKKIKWEESGLQPILQDAARKVAENIEWHGIPSLEVVCLFLTSPEAEAIIRQIYAAQFIEDERRKDLISIRKDFFLSFYLYSTSYASNVNLKEDQLAEASNILFKTLLEGCEQAFNVAIDEGKLSAHEARSAFRHRLLLEVLDAIEEKMTFLTSQQKPDIKEISTFEEMYRRLVSNRHKYITPPNFGRARQLPINRLYVSPDFVAPSSVSARSSSIEDGPQAQLFETQIISSCSYQKVLSGAFRMVLLGNPGGGKSTFAQKLCYDLTTHYLDRLFGGRRNITPIMVILRDYGPEKKNHNRSILEFIQMKVKGDYQLQPPPGAFEYLFLNGRALVIFDGLDELLDTRDRQEVSKAVESFCTLFPSLPVLVTSREVGYEQAPLDTEMVEVFRLAPFSEEQVQEYVKKWFDVITMNISLEQRKQKCESFLEESQMVPDLRTNPLMLALLCNVYQEENYIPTNRPDVYEKCANMLFERWDRSRGISVNISFDTLLRPTMTYLAYWIYSSEGLRGGVTEEKLISKTTEYLREKLLEDEAQKVAREFIELCKGRAWVFTNTGSTKHGEELFQFTHQTFLEYFTATYLCRKNPTPARLLSVLRNRIVKREWDVVAQLAFQKLSRDVEDAGNYLLSTLIKQAEAAGYEKWNLLSFTVRSLEFMMPSPSVIRNIVSACIRDYIVWGVEQSNKLSSQNKQVITEYNGPIERDQKKRVGKIH